MNDPQFVEAARVLAQRIMIEGGTNSESRIVLGFRLLTGKRPSQQQIELLQRQFQEALGEDERDFGEAASILATGEYKIDNNLNTKELIAYTKVMSTIMNFDATTMKR